MSISIMSLVFNATFEPLQYIHNGKDKKGKKFSKTITVLPPRIKLILLAYADHANDEGVSAYPGLTKLELKTGISRSGIVQTKKALIEHGFLVRVGESNRHTDDMTIIVSKLHEIQGGSLRLPVASSLSTPEVVASDYPNHPEPSFEPSINEEEDMPEIKPEIQSALEHIHRTTGEDISSPTPSQLSRARLSIAMQKGASRSNGNRIDGVPADVRLLLQTFANEWGFPPTARQKSGWIKEAREWREIGISAADIVPMVKMCRDAGTSIKGPTSITWAFYELNAPQETRSNLPEGV